MVRISDATNKRKYSGKMIERKAKDGRSSRKKTNESYDLSFLLFICRSGINGIMGYGQFFRFEFEIVALYTYLIIHATYALVDDSSSLSL